jgi:hypothetical protein
MVAARKRKRHRPDHKRWQREAPMQLGQLRDLRCDGGGY